MKLKFILLFLVFQINISIAQNWLQIYNDSISKLLLRIYENYDKGYIITGHCYVSGFHKYGLILKIDINGNRLWTKYCGSEESWSAFAGCRLFSDGSSIYSGNTYEYYSKMNPLVVKLNACGEKEWCKIYLGGGQYAAASQIETVPGGGYLFTVVNWKQQIQQNVWLFRTDIVGEIIWIQQFVADTAIFRDPFPRSLIGTSDSCFLLNGEAYSPDSLWPGYKILKIFSVKCDMNGNAIFQEPWGNSDGLASDYDLANIEDENHTYFVTGRLARTEPPYGDSPTIFHVRSDGKKDYYKTLISNSTTGAASTLNRLQDSCLIMSAGWSYGGNTDTLGVIKTNPTGDVLKKTHIITNNTGAWLWGATVTNDNKFIACGELNSLNAMVVKLNSELEYDSVYTYPFVYDSLCPYPIVTDTIPMNDCGIVTSVFDPVRDYEKTKLKIYPNPAARVIHIVMPEVLVRRSKGYGFTSSTYYQKWDESKIEIYDLNGNLIYTKQLSQNQKEITLVVNNLHDGMYFARLVYMNDVVAQAKFLVQK